MSDRPDQLEQADEVTARWMAANLANVPSPPEPVELAEDAVIECEDCGVIIDPRRARMGYTVCVDCGEFAERQSKRLQKNHRWED